MHEEDLIENLHLSYLIINHSLSSCDVCVESELFLDHQFFIFSFDIDYNINSYKLRWKTEIYYIII
jgi:hypothetical protein